MKLYPVKLDPSLPYAAQVIRGVMHLNPSLRPDDALRAIEGAARKPLLNPQPGKAPAPTRGGAA